MTSILKKYITQLFKSTLPNIRVELHNNSIDKLDIYFYYQRPENTGDFPLFYSADSEHKYVIIKGILNLDDYPNKFPQLYLSSDLAHSHVYC